MNCRNADVLKVCRSYQYTAINAIVRRAGKQRWGEHQQRGGFIWCTTGGGKTMTSFKAGQLILDLGFADKVVFVVLPPIIMAARPSSFMLSRALIAICPSKEEIL